MLKIQWTMGMSQACFGSILRIQRPRLGAEQFTGSNSVCRERPKATAASQSEAQKRKSFGLTVDLISLFLQGLAKFTSQSIYGSWSMVWPC